MVFVILVGVVPKLWRHRMLRVKGTRVNNYSNAKY